MKRLAVLFLTVLLALSLVLTGCQGNNNAQNDNNDNNNGNDKNVSDNNDKTDDKTNDKEVSNLNPVGEFPIVKEKISVKVQVNKDPLVEDLETNEATKMFEEKTNIHLDMEVTNNDNRDEKIKMMLASGDYPEVFMTANFTNNDIMDYGVRQGIFIPIDGLIEEYGERIKEVDEKEYAFLDYLYAPDGHIYGMPNMNQCYHCAVSQKGWINQTWLDNLGLDMPKTVDDLYDVLKAFKDEDANGNGDANDEIPISGQIDGWHGPIENFLMNPFILCDETSYFVVAEDQSLVFAPVQDEWKDGLVYMNKLYTEGLIDPLAFSQKNEQLKQLGNKDGDVVLGGFSAGHLQMVTTVRDQDPDCNANEYEVLPPLEGPGGVNVPYWPTATSGAKYVITDVCENPEAMLRWVDYAWTPEGTMTLEWGPEGEMWKYAEEGELDLEGEQAIWAHVMTCEGGEIHNLSWRQQGPDCRTFEGYRARWANDQDDRKETGYELFLYKRSVPYFENIPEPGYYYVQPFIAPDLVQDASALKTTIEEFVKMSMVQFITGEMDAESGDWDNYVKQVENMGLEKYMGIYGDAWADKAAQMK